MDQATEADLARDLDDDYGRIQATRNVTLLFNVARAALRRAASAEAQLGKAMSSTYCAFCGFTVALDANASLISEHIATCPQHPMRDVERRALAAEAEAARLRTLLEERPTHDA